MNDETTPISRRTGRLIVLLLGSIAAGIAILIVVLLTGNGGTEMATEDTSPVTGTIVDDAITDDVDPGSGSVTEATPAPASMTLEEVVQEVERLWPGSVSAELWGVDAVEGWSCVPNNDATLVSGSVATCRPDPPVEDRQHPVVTVLVLDGTGRVAIAEAGVQNPELSAETMYVDVTSGLNCTQFTNTDPGPASIDEPLRYFAAVLYWFLEGRPSPLMDIDENGIPCETKFTPDVVATLWDGGWLPPAPSIPEGRPVDAPVQSGDVLSVFGVAHDDSLNVRAQPGGDQPVVAELAPTADVAATGQARAVANSIWYEVETLPGRVGWVNSEYVAFATNPIEVPIERWQEWDLRAETVTELGQMIVDQLPESQELTSRTVVSVAPTDNEVTYDLVVIEHETIAGGRLRIVSEEDDRGSYVIVRIEQTLFCANGIDGRSQSCRRAT